MLGSLHPNGCGHPDFNVSFTTDAAGVAYFNGFYRFGTGNSDFTTPVTLGSTNEAHRAHAAIVLGDVTVDEVTITVTGASITDTGTITVSDSEVITIPAGTPANTYFETYHHWLGVVTITHTSGTAKACNFLLSEYWDSNETNFRVVAFDCKFRTGANDTAANIELLHHKAAGWTYNAVEPVPPAAIANFATEYSPYNRLYAGRNGKFERDGMLVNINGDGAEGLILRVTSGAVKTFESATFVARIS